MMKKLLCISGLFIVLMTVAVNAQETDTTTAKKMDPQAAVYYNNGVELMKSGKHQEAVAIFDSSLQIEKDARTYYMKGQALIKTNDMQGAKAAFEASLGLDKTFENALYALGNMNVALKNYDEAIKNYQELKNIAKTDAMKAEADKSIQFATETKAIEFYNTGNALAKENKFEEAIKNYDQSLAINKDYKTYYQKGLTLGKMGNVAESEKAFEECLALNNTFDMGYMALANTQRADKDYEAAIKNYEKALSVTQNEALKGSIQEALTNTYMIIGSTSLKEKKYDRAVEAFTKATENSDFDQAYLGLGRALTEKKQYDNALTAFDKAAQFKKTVTDGQLAYYKGVLYMNKGEKAKAIESFTAGAKDPQFKKACESQIAYMKAKDQMDKENAPKKAKK